MRPPVVAPAAPARAPSSHAARAASGRTARAAPGRTARAAAVALTCALAAACGDEKKQPAPPIYGRNEAVRATGPTATPAPPKAASAAPAAAPRRLCADASETAGKALSAMKLDRLEAAGAAPLGEKPAGGGRWLWVNLWAAWCGPCKEEIPRLRTWEAKLASLGTPVALAFVSLDDDERQARRFLESQPAGGLRASWWLPEGARRAAWLEALKVSDPPQLPMHFFFDPRGALRCQVAGAVDEGDFEQVRALVAGR
jgi:thiol-disulfide isomerase/thioredoxin